MACNEGVVLTIFNRPDVATHYWYRIEWSGQDDQRYSVEASDMNLLMRRAAEKEVATRARVWGEE
jgi:hypothetical protein